MGDDETADGLSQVMRTVVPYQGEDSSMYAAIYAAACELRGLQLDWQRYLKPITNTGNCFPRLIHGPFG